MIWIFIGLPGSGKGTQASIISKKYNFVHLSTGDIVRKEIEDESLLGLEIKHIVESGSYVSDDIILNLIDKHIHNGENYILDGFPRTLNQANKLDIILENRLDKIVGVIKFDINDDLIVERLTNRFSCAQCGQIYNQSSLKTNIDNICNICNGTKFIHRADDNKDKLKSRIQNYHDTTKPLEQFYRNKNLLFSVSAHESTDKVTTEIISLFNKQNLLIHDNENT